MDVKEALKSVAKPTQAEWARTHGISAAYVSDVIQGRREPGEKILKALGLEKVVTYVPSKAPSRPKPPHSGER